MKKNFDFYLMKRKDGLYFEATVDGRFFEMKADPNISLDAQARIFAKQVESGFDESFEEFMFRKLRSKKCGGTNIKIPRRL